MIPLQSLLNALQAWAQEELGGQRRIVAIIGRQEAALCANDTRALLDATQELEPEMKSQSERAERRRRLFQKLAAHWQVDAEALSLGSILERSGGHAGLAALREELRGSTAELVRRNRRFAALAGAQRRMIEELVAGLLQQDDPRALQQGGTLVNQRA